MLTVQRIEHRQYGDDDTDQLVQSNYIEAACLSSDAKPTGYANGSVLKEMDTGKLYLYDAANETWREW